MFENNAKFGKFINNLHNPIQIQLEMDSETLGC